MASIVVFDLGVLFQETGATATTNYGAIKEGSYFLYFIYAIRICS
jgi:hypothetical protein